MKLQLSFMPPSSRKHRRRLSPRRQRRRFATLSAPRIVSQPAVVPPAGSSCAAATHPALQLPSPAHQAPLQPPPGAAAADRCKEMEYVLHRRELGLAL